IIAANWDKSQTLAQNYRRLGLTAKLNKTPGGVEKKVSDVEQHDEDGLRIEGSNGLHGKIELKEAKIERDPKTGRILKVLGGDDVKPNPLNDPLNALDSDSDDGEFDQHGRRSLNKASRPK